MHTELRLAAGSSLFIPLLWSTSIMIYSVIFISFPSLFLEAAIYSWFGAEEVIRHQVRHPLCLRFILYSGQLSWWLFIDTLQMFSQEKWLWQTEKHMWLMADYLAHWGKQAVRPSWMRAASCWEVWPASVCYPQPSLRRCEAGEETTLLQHITSNRRDQFFPFYWIYLFNLCTGLPKYVSLEV